MSSTQDTKSVPKTETTTAETKPENKTCIKDEKNSAKDPKASEKNTDNKQCCTFWNFFRTKFFYFLLASGSVVSSYLVWKRYYKKH